MMTSTMQIDKGIECLSYYADDTTEWLLDSIWKETCMILLLRLGKKSKVFLKNNIPEYHTLTYAGKYCIYKAIPLFYSYRSKMDCL